MTDCDSCGFPADPQHVRERIERLELATRFRPVHIRVLLIDAAPPVRPEDYFYRAAEDRSVRSRAAGAYFVELLKCAQIERDSALGEEAQLPEFQRHGLFVAYAVECPIQQASDLAAAVRRAVPALLKRVRLSYKPKFIVPLSQACSELVPAFQADEWGDRLILDGGGPFVWPPPESGGRLAAAVAGLS